MSPNEKMGTREIQIRAYAARMQHLAENEEYPYTKAELRQALDKACKALHHIACWPKADAIAAAKGMIGRDEG